MASNGSASIKATLAEVWSRLDAVCRRLWDDNSPAAVGLQTLYEEFSGKVQGADQALTTARERVVYLEETLASKRAECDALLDRIRNKDEENAEFHDRYLKIEAAQDVERSKKMDAFYQEMTKKSADLEKAWEARRASYEEELARRAAALQKKNDDLAEALKRRAAELEAQTSQREQELSASRERMMQEMSSWDAKSRLEGETLLKREHDLEARRSQLEDEYAKKTLELEHLKEALQQEVSSVVRQYQAKLRSGEPGR